MKKTVLLLAVCLMLGLCACGLRGQRVAGNTVEPVHFSAPAVRQDAAPAEEPRVTLPQGASLLTEQELRWFGGSCFNVLPSRGPNLFLAASYNRAEDMDLASLFAAGAGSRELSDRELRQLGMDGCARLTAAELEDLLLRCTGLVWRICPTAPSTAWYTWRISTRTMHRPVTRAMSASSTAATTPTAP